MKQIKQFYSNIEWLSITDRANSMRDIIGIESTSRNLFCTAMRRYFSIRKIFPRTSGLPEFYDNVEWEKI